MRRFAAIGLALILAATSTTTLVGSASATSPTMSAAKAGRKARKKVKKLLRRQGLAKLPSVSGGGEGVAEATFWPRHFHSPRP